MARLVAEDVLLLCWDDERGRPHRRCSTTLRAGVGGALVIDGLRTGSLAAVGDRVAPTGRDPADPLLAHVVDQAVWSPRAPTVDALVRTVATPRVTEAVRDRLVARGVLRIERRRRCGVVPLVRFPLADRSAAAEPREAVRALLTGRREPRQAASRAVLLAGLAGSAGAVDLLVDPSQRVLARRRAAGLRAGRAVPARLDGRGDDPGIAAAAR